MGVPTASPPSKKEIKKYRTPRSRTLRNGNKHYHFYFHPRSNAGRCPSSTAGTPSVHPWAGGALLRRWGRRRYTPSTAGTPSVHSFDGGDAVGTLPRRRGRRRYTQGTGGALLRRRGRRRYTLGPVVCSKRELRGSRHLTGGALLRRRGRRRYTRRRYTL